MKIIGIQKGFSDEDVKNWRKEFIAELDRITKDIKPFKITLLLNIIYENGRDGESRSENRERRNN